MSHKKLDNQVIMNDPFPPLNDHLDPIMQISRSRECVESRPLDEVPTYKFRAYIYDLTVAACSG